MFIFLYQPSFQGSLGFFLSSLYSLSNLKATSSFLSVCQSSTKIYISFMRLQETKRGKERSSSDSFRENMTLQHLDFGLLACRTVGGQISAVDYIQFVVLCCGIPKKSKQECYLQTLQFTVKDRMSYLPVSTGFPAISFSFKLCLCLVAL